MSPFAVNLSRRSVLKDGGALVVSIAAPRAITGAHAAGDGLYWPPLSPGQLDTYLSIDEQGRVTAFFGKMDMGQGVDVSLAQIVAEELDIALDRVDIVMGDTALTVNQGGASGSSGLEEGGNPLRNAAAEARRVLSELGARRLGVLMSQVGTRDGTVYVLETPEQSAGYGELIGGQLVNRPELPPYGAGEPSTRTITPAIANAIFDATGVRLRRAPATPERVQAALQAGAI